MDDLSSTKEKIRRLVYKSPMIPRTQLEKELGHLHEFNQAVKELVEDEVISYGGRDWYYRTPRATMGSINSLDDAIEEFKEHQSDYVGYMELSDTMEREIRELLEKVPGRNILDGHG